MLSCKNEQAGWHKLAWHINIILQSSWCHSVIHRHRHQQSQATLRDWWIFFHFFIYLCLYDMTETEVVSTVLRVFLLLPPWTLKWTVGIFATFLLTYANIDPSVRWLQPEFVRNHLQLLREQLLHAMNVCSWCCALLWDPLRWSSSPLGPGGVKWRLHPSSPHVASCQAVRH